MNNTDKMLLILSPHAYGLDTEAMARTAGMLGWDIYNDGWRIPYKLLKRKGCVYGPELFCSTIAVQMGWELVQNDGDWMAKLPAEYSAREISYSTLAEARKLTEPKFIYPVKDESFEAKLYIPGDLPNNTIFDETPVIISDEMKYTSKYRCFVLNREVVSSCCFYLNTTKMPAAEIDIELNYFNNNDAVIHFVNTMLKDTRIECADSFVVNVGRYKKDTYCVINTSPVWNSEVYGCERVAVLDCLASSVEQKDQK